MRFNLTLLLVVVLALAPRQAPAQLVLVGNDEKVTWDDAGKPVFLPPGKDTVSVVDISNREAPRILVSLPLMNSVFGPPTNLQITPDGKLALVANSMAWAQDGGAWKPAPDTKLYVIDLTTDRKSTRLNSSHLVISYAVFCLKKKKKKQRPTQ